MNKRTKKKLLSSKRIKKVKNVKKCSPGAAIPEVSDKICPMCGVHTFTTENRYFCTICRNYYGPNELVSGTSAPSKTELNKIMEYYKK